MKRTRIALLVVLSVMLALCVGLGTAVFALYAERQTVQNNTVTIGKVEMELTGQSQSGEVVEEGSAYFNGAVSVYEGQFAPASYEEALAALEEDGGASIASALIEVNRNYGDVFFRLCLDPSSYQNNAQLNGSVFVTCYKLTESGGEATAWAHTPFGEAVQYGLEQKAEAGSSSQYRLFFTAESIAVSGCTLTFDVALESGAVPVTSEFSSEEGTLTLTRADGANGTSAVTLLAWLDGSAQLTVSQSGQTLYEGTASAGWQQLELQNVTFTNGTASLTVAGGALHGKQLAFGEATCYGTVPNAGFESGDLSGWYYVSGSSGANVSSAQTYWEGDDRFIDQNGQTVQKFLQEGSSFLITDEGSALQLRSSKFVLEGDGILSFMLGTAKNPTCYVALCDAETDEELVTMTNSEYFNDPLLPQVLLRRFMYAHEYIGRTVYFKIVDGATADFGFVTFDDLQISLTYEEAAALAEEEKEYFATYRQDVLDASLSGEVTAKDVVNAIRAYYAALEVTDYLNVILTKGIEDKALTAGVYDLTQYLSEAEATLFGGSVTVRTVTQVDDGTQLYTDGFGSFTLEAGKTYTVTYRLANDAGDKCAEATFAITVTSANDVINGNFETGDLTGWTVVSGGDAVVVTDEELYWQTDANFNDQNGDPLQYFLQEGEYFLRTSGADGTNEVATAELRSSSFVLGGDGVIAFRFGAAKSPANYVALCRADTGEELVKVTNEGFADPARAQVLLLQFLYAHKYVGEEVYIKIVDGATADFGFVTFDDLQTSLTLAEAQAIAEAEKTKMATYRQDVLDSAAQMGASAKTIVEGLRAYYDALEVLDLTNVVIRKEIGDQSVAAGEHDLTQYLAEAEADMIGETSFTGSIVGVTDGQTQYTEGFAAFDLEAGKTYTVTYRFTAATSGKYAEATFTITVNSSYQIINGDFETGDLTGWTYIETNGTTGVASTTDSGWNGLLNQEGNYHYDGWAETGEGWTGVLRSTTFELGGNGMISFRLGGCNRISDPKDGGAYLSVKKANGTEVARFVNTKQEPYNGGAGKGEQYMWVYAFDLSSVAEIGDQLYIEIVDNATGNWGLLFLDDVQTYHTRESIAALGTVNTDYFMAENKI